MTKKDSGPINLRRTPKQSVWSLPTCPSWLGTQDIVVTEYMYRFRTIHDYHMVRYRTMIIQPKQEIKPADLLFNFFLNEGEQNICANGHRYLIMITKFVAWN